MSSRELSPRTELASSLPLADAAAASGHLRLAEPPFTRKRVGPLYAWSAELDLAHAFASENGFSLHLSSAAYEVAVLTGPDFRLLIYPHTVKSTRNQHLRVRDHGSKNKRRAQAVMAVLDRAAGFNCTFSTHWTKNDLAHRWTLALLDRTQRAAVYAEAGVRDPDAPADASGTDVAAPPVSPPLGMNQK